MESPPARMHRVIAFMNQKGGVGKTTTTVNLAAALAEAGHRVLVIDLDPQAHATLHLGVDPGILDGSVYDILLAEEPNPRVVTHRVSSNLDLIPAETDLAAAETDLASAERRQLRLRVALDEIRGEYDFIMLDCPPSLGMLTINGLAAAHEVVIPMQAHFLALQGVGKLLETVTLVRSSLNPGLTVSGVVLCMYDAQTTHTQEVVADIESFFTESRDADVAWREAKIFRPAIRRNIKLAECPSFGQSIFDYAPLARGAQDYRRLANAIAPSPTTEIKPLSKDVAAET